MLKPGCGLHPGPDHELLLRAALLPPERARDAWAAWRARTDLDQLDASSLRTLPLVWSNLGGALGDDGFDRWVRGIVRASWLKAQSLAAGVRPALAALAAAEIPLLLVKGMAVAPYFPRGFADRPMIDFDLAVPRELRLAAWQRLEASGFRPQIDLPEDSPLLAERGSWNFLDDHRVDIDLHWRTLPLVAHPEADALVWAASRPTDHLGVACRLPAPRHVLLQAVLHAASWEPAPAIRWAADVTLLVRGVAEAELDWAALVADARALRVTAPLGAALGWLVRTFALPVPRGVLADLARPPRWQRRELAGLAANPAERSAAERRAVALGLQVRRDLPPGREPGIAARLDLGARRRGLRGAWALPLWGAFVALGRPAPLRRLAERARLPRGEAPSPPAGGRLEFGHRGSAEPHLGAGWEWGGEHGRWTRGAEARLHVALPPELRAGLELEWGVIPYVAARSRHRRVDLWANGERIARWEFRGEAVAATAERRLASVPARLLAGGRLDLLLHVRDPLVPDDQHGHAHEPRAFGLHVGWLALRPASGC